MLLINNGLDIYPNNFKMKGVLIGMGIFNFLFGSHPPKSVSEQLVDMVSAPQAETEMYKVILSGKKHYSRM